MFGNTYFTQRLRQRQALRELRGAVSEVVPDLNIDEVALSMGMSGDFDEAVG